MKTATDQFYYPELDVLRFIAFLLVFIHNSSPILINTFLDRFAEYTWFGVDLFFCLSAYLITKILVTEYQRNGSFNFRNFYMRRILRIWPLYFFYIALASLIVILSEGWSVNLLKHIAALATFTFNLAYFGLLPFPLLIFIHLWSISYEEQFYAIIPWFLRKLLALEEKQKWIFIGVIFVLGNISRALFIYLRVNPAADYILPINRFESILGGLAIGLGLFNQFFDRIHAEILFACAILCLVIVFFLPNYETLGWNLVATYSLVGVGMTFLVFTIVKKQIPFFKTISRNKALVYLGKISYGLYVFHFGTLALSSRICIDFLGLSANQPTYIIATMSIGFVLTVLFAVLAYRYIETPFLKLKERFTLVSSRPV